MSAQFCELGGCDSRGAAAIPVGRYQVYDGDQPTMTRPAWMCKSCVELARKYGMTVKEE